MARYKLFYLIAFFVFIQLEFIQAQSTASYSELISSADAYFAKKDYYNAKTTYQLALQLDTGAAYPKKQIADIIQKLNDELEIRIVYEEKISQAEEAYRNNAYQKSIDFYKEAAQIIDYESLPKDEINRIQKEWEALKKKESDYNKLLEEAQAAKLNQKFDEAISILEKALPLYPAKVDVLSEIGQLRLLLKQQNEKLDQFNKFATLADKYLKQERFQAALENYEQALVLFEKNAYVNEQIEEVKRAIEVENAYNNWIEKADNFYIALELDKAKQAYEEAINIWSTKDYPKNMIAKIGEAKQRQNYDLELLNKDYNAKIATADKHFDNEKYENAYDVYVKALNLKPEEKYPQSQIQKLNKLLASGSIDIKVELHDNGIALADASIEITENGLVERINVGSNGKHKLKLKLNANYILKFEKEGYIHKIFAIDSHLPDDKDLNTVFTTDLSVELFPLCGIDLSLLDKPLANISYREDLREFNYDFLKVESIIQKVDKLKKECLAAIAEQDKLKAYEALLAEAKSFKESEDYNAAIAMYTQAASLYPNKSFANAQIKLLNALLSLDKEYNLLIANGDAKYSKSEYNEALYDYYKAKNLKPKATYPQEKIKEIDALLAVQSAADQVYQKQLLKADSLFSVASYKEAVVAYTKAIELKKDALYPQNRLKETNELLAAQNKLEASYQAAITTGDGYFEKQDLVKAKTAYTEALRIKPNEQYPLYKIEDINTIQEQGNIRETNNRYKELIASADKLFKEKAYTVASNQYTQASNLKPKETYPPIQIAKINQILKDQMALETQYKAYIKTADSNYYLNEWQGARRVYVLAKALKSTEIYPQEQIDKIDATLLALQDLDKNYNAALARADASFKAAQYNPAKTDYTLALSLKANEAYPKQKLEEIENILAQMSALESAYQKAIDNGDRNFSVKNYTAAKTNFQEALKIKEAEVYPKNKISEIELILAKLAQIEKEYNQAIASADLQFNANKLSDALPFYKKAQTLKPEENYPPDQIYIINARLAQVETSNNAYANAITLGDTYFKDKVYPSALSSFQKATEIKPNESYPQEKIKEIELIMAQLAQIEEDYNQAIASADAEYNANKYAEALPFYKEAQTLKPAENYPPNQIYLINAKLADQATSDQAYANAITKGDTYYKEEAYSLSLAAFQNAAEIKPQENYPQEKISEIEKILAKLAQLEKEYNLAIASADAQYNAKNFTAALPFYKEALKIKPKANYPADQIYKINAWLEEQMSTDEAYANSITKGDNFFKEKAYKAALSPYQKASQIKPAEAYPKDQIIKLRELIGAGEKEYQAFIRQGDDAYRMVNFQDAILAYEGALGIFPSESYPRMMLDKIDAQIRRESVLNLVSKPETILAGTDKRFDFEAISYGDRMNNYILIEMKNASEGRVRVFINFGKDGSKNGGYTLNLFQRDGYTKYFVRIDRQIRWQNTDNNWISLMAEGGDLEVKMIQISKVEKLD